MISILAVEISQVFGTTRAIAQAAPMRYSCGIQGTAFSRLIVDSWAATHPSA